MNFELRTTYEADRDMENAAIWLFRHVSPSAAVRWLERIQAASGPWRKDQIVVRRPMKSTLSASTSACSSPVAARTTIEFSFQSVDRL